MTATEADANTLVNHSWTNRTERAISGNQGIAIFTCLHEQWSSTRSGFRGFGAQHQEGRCRFLQTWKIAHGSPKFMLARHERFLPDLATTVLSVHGVR